MINQQERYYNILKLNKWFAISSILFTLIWVLTFANDFNRPWKKYQIQFRQMEIEKTRADIAVANQDLESDAVFIDLKVQLETAQNEVESRQDEMYMQKIKYINSRKQIWMWRNIIMKKPSMDMEI